MIDADITIFGGDLNAVPMDNMHQPYGMLRLYYLKKAIIFSEGPKDQFYQEIMTSVGRPREPELI